MKTKERAVPQAAAKLSLEKPHVSPENRIVRGAGILALLTDGEQTIGVVCASFEGREHEIDAHHLARSDLFS